MLLKLQMREIESTPENKLWFNFTLFIAFIFIVVLLPYFCTKPEDKTMGTEDFNPFKLVHRGRIR